MTNPTPLPTISEETQPPRCGDCRWWLGNSSGVGLCLAKAADPLWNFVGGGPVVSSSDECKCEGKLFTPKDPAHDQR